MTGSARVSRVPVRRLRRTPAAQLSPTWQQARPARIAASLAAATRDPGGWFVVGASSDFPAHRSVARTVAGTEVALWRGSAGQLVAGPGACPHLGALLGDCPLDGDDLLCRWHGLRISPRGASGWQPWPAHDDGVLAWVRLPSPGETATDRPVHLVRPAPAGSVAAVIAVPARCEPRDIIANRLDPWHGAWFHPYAFSNLTVDELRSDPDRLVLEVAFRLGPRWAVPVTAEFTCPDARTIVMRITDGEGTGSVVETHATPLGTDGSGHPVTVMTEATIATSPRLGFRLATLARPVLQAAIRRSARRLWVDDLAYAERLARLRG